MDAKKSGNWPLPPGGTPTNWTCPVRIGVDVPGDDSARRESGQRGSIPGDDPGRIAASIKAYEDVGAQHVIISTNTGNVANLTRQMEVIARDVFSPVSIKPPGTRAIILIPSVGNSR